MPEASDPPTTAAPSSGRDAPGARRAHLRYQPALDGIRGIGLTFVLASHAGFAWAKGGFFWVSSFFTLSGYLIATLLLREHDAYGTISLRTFWSRRFRRLMPGALLALGGIALFGATIADGTQLERLRGDALAALAYVANWRFVLTDTSYADLFLSPSPVQHFWTLSIEEQFYLVLPLGVLAGVRLARGHLGRFAAALVLLCAASVLWMRHLHSAGVHVDRMYFGTDTRLPELLGGVLLAVLLHRWPVEHRPGARRVVVAFGTVALAVMLFVTFTVHRTDPWLYDGGLALYAVVSMGAIAAALDPRSLVRRVLSVPPLPWIGRLSYGAYLFHWPLYLWLDEARTGLDRWPLFVLRFALTLALAQVSLTLVEQPIRERRALLGPSVRLAVPAAVGAVVLALVLVTLDPPPPAVRLTGADQAMPSIPSSTTLPTTTDRPPSTSPSTSPSTTTAPVTTLPDRPARILVVGDSQAWVLGNALVRWGQRGGGQAVVWNQAIRGCGIVRGGEAERLGEITQGVCGDWVEFWGAAARDFDPDVVVALSGSWDFVDRRLPEWGTFLSYGDAAFDAHLVAEYRALTDLFIAGGARVVWLTTPCYELEGFGEDPRHLNRDLLPAVLAGTDDRQVRLVDLFARVCPGDDFTQQLGGFDDARPDGLHLSDEAADWVSDWLGPQLVAPAPDP